MRRLIYKAIFDRIFFPSSLVCSYINIKNLSGNKLLHYTWHGYKSWVQTPEKPARVQWVAGWEPCGHPWTRLCCPRPGRLRERGICRCSYRAPLKKTGCPQLACVLLAFRACPGNLSREAMSEGIIPSGWLTSSDKAGRERDFDW